MMTRKHFQEIARICREHYAPRAVVEDLAKMCWRENPRFSRETFIKACGYEEL